MHHVPIDFAKMVYRIDGHELSVVTIVSGGLYIANACLPKGWPKQLIHKAPMAGMALAMGLGGIALPIIVVPIRRALKLPTNQYDPHHPDVVFPKWD